MLLLVTRDPAVEEACVNIDIVRDVDASCVVVAIEIVARRRKHRAGAIWLIEIMVSSRCSLEKLRLVSWLQRLTSSW